MNIVLKTNLKNNNKQTGNDGENRAAAFLEENGYKIIERNFRTRSGEVDIIAQKENTIIFAEVKTLPKGNIETLEHVLSLIKQKKIIETAKFFLLKYRKYNDSFIRFDVLAIDVPGLDPVYHIQNAFSELL